MNFSLTKLAALLLICTMPFRLAAQDSAENLFKKAEGYWQGAFIKNNSFQKIDVQFYEEAGKFTSLQVMEEWHPQFGEFVLPVSIDSLGRFTFNTGYGEVKAVLDTGSLEIIGTVQNTLPAVYLHLKKIPPPPAPRYSVAEVSINDGPVSLAGHLHIPDSPSKTAVIIIGGRGCYAGNTKYDLYAKLLRRYGISVLAFDKRGTGKSAGDCTSATVGDLADDLIACKDFLANHPNEYTKIGVLGSSAGAWVMTKAEEKTDFDFMIGISAPAVSVKEQQLQSMNEGFAFYKLPEKTKSALAEYTELMLAAKPNAENFARFQELLKVGKKDGWYRLLDATDIPLGIREIDNLWVRRHAYDPAQILSTYDKPFLAIYGETDWIVSPQQNIDKLRDFFRGDRKDLLTTIIAHDAEHGTETPAKYVTLAGDISYWRFYRISPAVQIELIDFLRKNGFTEKSE